MVTAIVICSIGVVVYIASDLFQEDSVTRVQEINKETAEHLGQRVESVFEDSFNRLTLMAQFATRSATKEEAVRAIRNTLAGADDLISFVAYQIEESGKLENIYTVVQDSAMAEFGLKSDQIRDLPRDHVLQAQLNNFDKINLVNSAPDLKIPIFSMSFISKDAKDNITINPKLSAEEKLKLMKGRWLFRGEIRHDPILKLFSNKKFQVSYLVDAAGHLLAHSDPQLINDVISGADYSTNPIVWKLTQEKMDNQQMEYIHDDGDTYLGAYKKLSISGIGVITEVQKKLALATINRVQYRAFLVMIIVVCAAFIMNFLFSQSLTSPLKKLFSATEQIVTGNYNVNLKVQSEDEIGALSKAFLNMTDGLKEREKLKGAFSKFHSKEVAQKLLNGEIKLGGERKHVTVFFSDIRGFTQISEKLSPDQVVAFLNEYMTEMVKIIYKWSGVVDKYVGDAIMAEWGVPNTTPDDAYNAVRAALEMRDFLDGFNKSKKALGEIEIHIGIGLHSGDVLAGNIGSEERLEYTVIGDTVNQAARIEAANKALSTDLLISETTYLLVKSRGIDVGPVLYIKAKGKTEPIKVFKVIGYRENNQLITSLNQDVIEQIKSQHDIVITSEEEKVESVTSHAVEHSVKKVHSQINVLHLENTKTETQISNNSDRGLVDKIVKSNSLRVDKIVKSNTPHIDKIVESNNPLGHDIFANSRPSESTKTAVLENSNSEPKTETLISSFASGDSDTNKSGAESKGSSFGSGVESISQIENISPDKTIGAPINPDTTKNDPNKEIEIKDFESKIVEPIEGGFETSEWYLVDAISGGDPEGPYTLGEIQIKAKAKQIDLSRIHGFRAGDAETTPVFKLPGMEKRKDMPPIKRPAPTAEFQKQVQPHDWYVHGAKDNILGPFSKEQLKMALENGHITRTAHLWSKGLPGWIYLYQVDGFDRRKKQTPQAA